jgi:hypothetical protein
VGVGAPTPPLSAALGLPYIRSLPRATKRLASEVCRPTTPISAALGFSSRRLAIAGNEALDWWELPPPPPTLSAALGFSSRRLATADKEALGW